MTPDGKAYYPVGLNVVGRQCVVVGGGEVAWRKVAALREYGAVVTVISPALCPELAQMVTKQEIAVVSRAYHPGDLQGAFLAISATDDAAVNATVAAEARHLRVLVNVVDNAALSDFILPSYLRRGGITIAVSTAGLSPALARKIRLGLETEFGPEYATLAKLVAEVRAMVRQEGKHIHGDSWQQALDVPRLLDLIKKGELERARDILFNNLKASTK